jgi:excisionase family DNA binding protein
VDDTALLKVEEVAAWLGVRPSWVYRHVDDLGAYRLGKYLRFSRARVLENLAKASWDSNPTTQNKSNT